jgi:hypothetical protein
MLKQYPLSLVGSCTLYNQDILLEMGLPDNREKE